MLMTKFFRRKAMSDTSLAVINNVIREAAHPVTMASEDYDPLIELIGDAHFVLIGEDTEVYGYEAGFGMSKSCEDEVVNQLVELQHHTEDYSKRDGRVAEDEFFYAEQNARLAIDAEEYYRTMFIGKVSSWNLRDTHMVETLDALVAHLDRQFGQGSTKVVVWEHNSHLGDARAT